MSKVMIATSIGEILDCQDFPTKEKFLRSVNAIVDTLDAWRDDIDFSKFYYIAESVQIDLEVQIYDKSQNKNIAIDEINLLKREFEISLRKFTFPSFLYKFQEVMFLKKRFTDSDVLISFIERHEYKQAFEYLYHNIDSFDFFSKEDCEVVNFALKYY